MARLSADELADRHPGVIELLTFFEYAHLPDHLQAISRPCAELAHEMVGGLPDGAELTAGLRKLLEGKDCFVRQALRTTITRERGPWVAPNAREAVAGLEVERKRLATPADLDGPDLAAGDTLPAVSGDGDDLGDEVLGLDPESEVQR